MHRAPGWRRFHCARSNGRMSGSNGGSIQRKSTVVQFEFARNPGADRGRPTRATDKGDRQRDWQGRPATATAGNSGRPKGRPRPRYGAQTAVGST
ncbi:hypothetical protein C6Q35_28105 [Burkholderia multivorans]|nr:hypothetical protein C6Q35_28105 [Burkholderia multivorans]